MSLQGSLKSEILSKKPQERYLSIKCHFLFWFIFFLSLFFLKLKLLIGLFKILIFSLIFFNDNNNSFLILTKSNNFLILKFIFRFLICTCD